MNKVRKDRIVSKIEKCFSEVSTAYSGLYNLHGDSEAAPLSKKIFGSLSDEEKELSAYRALRVRWSFPETRQHESDLEKLERMLTCIWAAHTVSKDYASSNSSYVELLGMPVENLIKSLQNEGLMTNLGREKDDTQEDYIIKTWLAKEGMLINAGKTTDNKLSLTVSTFGSGVIAGAVIFFPLLYFPDGTLSKDKSNNPGYDPNSDCAVVVTDEGMALVVGLALAVALFCYLLQKHDWYSTVEKPFYAANRHGGSGERAVNGDATEKSDSARLLQPG